MDLDKKDKRLIAKVLQALEEVYTRDWFLIKNRCHEVAIVGAFYRYFSNKYGNRIRKKYPEVCIDMEYSRMGEEMCAKPAPPNEHGKKHMRIAFVVHKRNAQIQNILAIEFKLEGRDKDIDWDYEKLKAVTIKSEDEIQVRNYGLGISIVLKQDGLVMRYFKDGSECDKDVKYKWEGIKFALAKSRVCP